MLNFFIIKKVKASSLLLDVATDFDRNSFTFYFLFTNLLYFSLESESVPGICDKINGRERDLQDVSCLVIFTNIWVTTCR